MEIQSAGFAYNFGKPNEQKVFENLNVKFSDGKFHVILGKSGCGKSTLLHMAGGLLKPQIGKVDYDGIDLYSLSQKELSEFINRNISFVFQEFFLDENFSIADNVAMPLMIRKIKYKEIVNKAKLLLEKVGLKGAENKSPSELSGGECQRVCIARALITEPKYVFADEPTGNLDSENSATIIEMLHDIVNDDRTVVMVTHDESAIRDTDIILRLSDGGVINE